MKSKIFVALALLTVIVFSAFTLNNNTGQKTTEDPLFWYYIDGSGNLGAPVDGSQLTKTEAMEIVPCEDVAGDDCARGYTTQQFGYGFPAPTVSNDDEHIKYSN